MSEHLSLQQQTALIEHKLDSRFLPQTLAHLAECAACRAQVSQLRGGNEHALFWPAEADWSFTQGHLGYEQLAGYVTASLAEVEREIAANHLAVCEFCAAEVRALQLVKEELQELSVETSRQPRAPAPVWRRFWLFAPPAWAWGVALLLLLSLSGWWLWQAKRVGRSELALTPQPAAPAVAPVQTAAPSNEASQPNDTLLALVDHGQSLALRTDGQLSSPLPLPETYQALLKHTMTNQQLALPTVLNELKAVPRNLRGGESARQRFALLAPLGKVVQTDRPSFRWQSVPGASSYTVAVLDQNFNSVLTSAPLTQSAWSASQPLPRGRVYLWQVTAQVGAQQISAPAATEPEARFQILAQEKVDELQRATAKFSQSHLLLGALYAQAGLLQDAERQLQALLAENPQSPLVKKLLQQVRQAR